MACTHVGKSTEETITMEAIAMLNVIVSSIYLITARLADGTSKIELEKRRIDLFLDRPKEQHSTIQYITMLIHFISAFGLA